MLASLLAALVLALPALAAAETKPAPLPRPKPIIKVPQVLDLSAPVLGASVGGALSRPLALDREALGVGEPGLRRRPGEARLDATIRPTHRRFRHDVQDPSLSNRPDSIGLRLRVPLGDLPGPVGDAVPD